MDSIRQEKWLKQTTANPSNHREQDQGQDHTTPVAAPREPASAVNHQQSCHVPPSLEATTAAQQTFGDEVGELIKGPITRLRARRLGITVA